MVTAADAVKIRAGDGRAVHGMDLSPFINHLPYGKSTQAFTTELASSSTSQAAARLDASVKPGKSKLKVRGTDALIYGRGEVDLRAVEQLADSAQLRAVGRLMQRLHARGGTMEGPVAVLEAHLAEPVTAWADRPDGDLARPRLMEVMAAINRLRE